MEQNPSSGLNTQLVKKFFPAFYGTWRFISVFTRLRHWASWIRFASSPHPSTYFPKIHSNIVFASTIKSSNWSLSFRFPN